MHSKSTERISTCLHCNTEFNVTKPSNPNKYCSKACHYASSRDDWQNRYFWPRIHKTHSCWLWLGNFNSSGYGHFQVGGKTIRAHMASWELANGAIPDGMLVLHCCPEGSRRDCVNPGHLYLGDHYQNAQDRQREGRTTRGSSHKRAKLTEASVQAIRAAAVAGTPRRQLAAQYGVHLRTIYTVLSRVGWAHVE